jgi:hypothetical protein
MERTHTRHQLPRSSRPDAEKFNRMYTAYESFIDVDGEFVLERIQHLADVAFERQLPISFQ